MNDAKTTSRVLKCVVMLGIGCGVAVLAFCFWRFGCHEVENAQSRKSLSASDVNVGQTSRQDVARSRRSAGQSHLPRRPLASVAPAKRISIGTVATVSAGVPEMEGKSLSEKIPAERSASERAQMASDKNQLMDELLNQPDIPADYGMQMVALFRDREQDVVTRDFAVQHIGLYAEALNRRGVYRVDSVEVRTLRAALDEAAAETKTIVAAAAFRALADMAAFDPHIDGRRLDGRFAACAADSSAAPAARVMAVQLCGERKVASARPTLAALAADHAAPEPLRRSALHAIKVLDQLD